MFTEREIERFFRPLHETGKIARYPLTNIAKDEHNNLLIEVAVAGFNKQDLSVELKGNELHITGQSDEAQIEGVTYLQRHISTNTFNRIVILHEKYVGGDISASVANGILSVMVIPKDQPKKLIEIN